jgi:hypothetical protein
MAQCMKSERNDSRFSFHQIFKCYNELLSNSKLHSHEQKVQQNKMQKGLSQTECVRGKASEEREIA